MQRCDDMKILAKENVYSHLQYKLVQCGFSIRQPYEAFLDRYTLSRDSPLHYLLDRSPLGFAKEPCREWRCLVSWEVQKLVRSMRNSHIRRRS